MAGNFIADTLRGRELNHYPQLIQKGVRLHRFIDTYTDTHDIPLRTRRMLYPYFGKYAAVVQDVFYDHFLAANWDAYHEMRLKEYTRFAYKTLQEAEEFFNERAARTFHYMYIQDWLTGYASDQGIDRALSGLSRRAKFESNMDRSLPVLRRYRSEIDKDFRQFFPELISASKDFVSGESL